MRRQNRKAAAIVATLEEAAISPKQMLAALRAELVKIQTAIAAVEALG